MSDFLSNFDQDNYGKTIAKKEKNNEKKPDRPAKSKEVQDEEALKREIERRLMEEYDVEVEVEDNTASKKSMPKETIKTSRKKEKKQAAISSTVGEEVEIDPTYKKKKQKQLIVGTIIGVVSGCLIAWAWYSYSHVEVPNFKNKTVSEARTWSSENDVAIKVETEFNTQKEANVILKQKPESTSKLKKKETLILTASKGPDPDEVLPLPDFSKLSKAAATEWIVKNKADNVTVLDDYSDKKKEKEFIKLEFKDKDVTEKTYTRSDQVIVTYSKGKEVFEKDITVPDFKGKSKEVVEEWVKKNELEATYEKSDSDKIEEGLVISQSHEKGQKIAKKSPFKVVISEGKSVMVPNFSDYTMESATSVEGLEVTVKQVFSGSVPYGNLISQSVEAGTKLKTKEQARVTATYSNGRPYLRSYFGQLEGDLEKAFYEDYRSKGAAIYYQTYEKNSTEEKGTVVEMSAYNQYVPMEYTVKIGISNGKKAPKPVKKIEKE
ncbi:PASTA domain-containing protein [Vagococcus fessus]|uniref:PASTA domain-containing protein n=1 Tax=Vagococcus fessus TaxID=120370 RepID=A0A430A7P4_9ENTE|nr:PASTA domain-containing protein [Vagococcus fessus]RSU03101.1 hypothetical protein CBF31_05125 [Vagococcus fessus]